MFRTKMAAASRRVPRGLCENNIFFLSIKYIQSNAIVGVHAQHDLEYTMRKKTHSRPPIIKINSKILKSSTLNHHHHQNYR